MPTKRFFQAALAVFLLVAAITLPQTAASASTPDFVAQIKGFGSGRCLDDPNNNPNNNVRMDIYACESAANEFWDWNPNVSPTGYNVFNEQSGKCLTVLNNGTADNSPIIQYTCNWNANERWYTDSVPGMNGKFYIRTEGSGNRCLTVLNNGTANNSQLVLYTCGGGANQIWYWGTISS